MPAAIGVAQEVPVNLLNPGSRSSVGRSTGHVDLILSPGTVNLDLPPMPNGLKLLGLPSALAESTAMTSIARAGYAIPVFAQMPSFELAAKSNTFCSRARWIAASSASLSLSCQPRLMLMMSTFFLTASVIASATCCFSIGSLPSQTRYTYTCA